MAYFKVKVRTRAPARISDIADLLSHNNNVTDIYGNGAEVSVKRCNATAVVNYNISAVTVRIAVIGALLCKYDRSGVCGNNFGSVNSGTGNVNAGMKVGVVKTPAVIAGYL